MTDRPAATLLHTGPGLANGLANLHNARKAASPLVNLIGDHATPHRALDAPLSSDVEAIARPVSGWVRTSASPRSLPEDAAAAVAAAREPPGRVATLIIPADCAWSEGATTATAHEPPLFPACSDSAVEAARAALRSGGRSALLLGGRALREGALAHASRIASETGAQLRCDSFTTRLQRGAGRAHVAPLPYFSEAAIQSLAGVRHLVLVGAAPPVAFFAYPGVASRIAPEDCEIHTLASPAHDAEAALEALAESLGAPANGARLEARVRDEPPTGRLDPESIHRSLCALLPENAIVSDEAILGGFGMLPLTRGAAPHDWLSLMGGAIGQGLPLATGAALACPDRKVVCLEGDGSAMYTLQALWTQAREGLDVTTVIFANRSYAILGVEFERFGMTPGPRARELCDLRRPDLNFVALARGMGVPASRAESAEAFHQQLAAALEAPGPQLVEAII
jgi:acetolactate synthase-1/2/3 large subunit